MAGHLTPRRRAATGERRDGGRYVGPVPIRVVHLVAKTHLDLGFTALASEVEQQYLDDFFPRAIAVASELRDAGGRERLVWTTGSWILHRALHQADGGRAAAVDAAIHAGDLAWHALPLTTHTELMDVPMFRSGLGISQELDDRFGCTTTAAKMTDVPGHTRSMVPLLAEAGVTFLHLGVNPAWPVPDVPPVFRWRSPDGAEVVVAYQAGGYGGEITVAGCDEALAFLHSGDNLGPPSVDDVRAAHAELRARFPDAEVRASTLDAFARALAASSAVADLPVVTAEIGDPWIFGVASDPQKVAAYRWLLDLQRRFTELDGSPGPTRPPEEVVPFDRTMLLVAEHTWGLDQKIALPGDRSWSNEDLARLRATPAGRRFEASWAEQRAYLDRAMQLVWGSEEDLELDHHQPLRSPIGVLADLARKPEAGWTAETEPSVRPVDLGEPVVLPPWRLVVDPETAAVVHLEHLPSGRTLAGPDHPLGQVTHQSFDEADYDRFYAGLVPSAEDEGWARWDNTKPGIDACGARAARWHLRPVRALGRSWHHSRDLQAILVEARFPDDAVALGAPPTVWLVWSRRALRGELAGELALEVRWTERAPTRLPIATWCSFVPIVAEPERWELDKLGQRVSPLDVVRRGGRSLHAVGEGMHYDGPDGHLTIATSSAPLVAPGAPNLLDADPPVPDLAGGFHVLLHDNGWATNFPMWNEGPAAFAFTISVD